MALFKLRRLLPVGHLFDAFEVTGVEGDHIYQRINHTIPYDDWTQTTIFVEGEAENWKRQPAYDKSIPRKPGHISCDTRTGHDGDGSYIQAGLYEIICKTPTIRYYCIRPATKSYSARNALRMKAKETKSFVKGDYIFLANGSVSIGKQVYTGPHLIEVTSPEITIKAKNDILGVVFKFDAPKSIS
jgi:hypothetical protein